MRVKMHACLRLSAVRLLIRLRSLSVLACGGFNVGDGAQCSGAANYTSAYALPPTCGSYSTSGTVRRHIVVC
jgi:glutaminase